MSLRLLQLYRLIPLTQLMQIQWIEAGERSVILRAPLSVNHNDKGTAFAGSLSALLQVAGWELWRNWLNQELGMGFAVAATECRIRYQHPVVSDFTVEAHLPDVYGCAQLRDKLQRHHKTRIISHLQVGDDEGTKVRADVVYALYALPALQQTAP